MAGSLSGLGGSGGGMWAGPADSVRTKRGITRNVLEGGCGEIVARLWGIRGRGATPPMNSRVFIESAQRHQLGPRAASVMPVLNGWQELADEDGGEAWRRRRRRKLGLDGSCSSIGSAKPTKPTKIFNRQPNFL